MPGEVVKTDIPLRESAVLPLDDAYVTRHRWLDSNQRPTGYESGNHPSSARDPGEVVKDGMTSLYLAELHLYSIRLSDWNRTSVLAVPDRALCS